MRRLLLLMAIIGIFAVGCQHDNTTDNIADGDGDTLISLSLPDTRTSLGEKSGENYPLYWSEGDRIAVNGVASSDIEIDKENPSSAKFTIGSALSYPYYIVYPYSASTSAERATVEFQSEQSYIEGSFSKDSAPMCGYIERSGQGAVLQHLATILRLPVKAKQEGVMLEKITITAGEGVALAGEFEVDCANAVITPTEGVTNKITYTLPADFTLSTSQEHIFYISLPATDVGRCTIEFVEHSGEKMSAIWQPSASLEAGIVREFGTISYEHNTVITLQSLVAESDELTIFYKSIHGYVRYSDGTPIEGVGVSDGFQVVATDANGYYKLDGITPQSWYIYCSMPADVKMPINEYGQPCYFQRYPSGKQRYDFTFERLEDGIEKEFVIVAMADTQVSSIETIERFSLQAAPEIKSYTKSLNLPCYGVVLGDMVADKDYLMEDLRAALSYDKMGFPVFHCYGNHDHITISSAKPVFPDERNFDYNIKIQRSLEDCFGPINYSYNRGDVHIISMRNVLYNTNKSSGNYRTAFTDVQYEWLKQDLALVPKDKMVVLCVHIPLLNSGSIGDGTNRKEVRVLLDQFAEAHILSGHTHYQHPYDHKFYNTGHTIYEHCMAAVRWDMNANIHRDGTPNGYTILQANGNTFSDWYYKGYPYKMNDRNYQMRLYRGGSIFGAEPSGSNSYGTKGYYQIPFDDGTLLANIFSSDPSWSVEVYEDGIYSGKMEHFYNIKGSTYDELVGDLTLANPKRVADGVVSSRDFWAIGVLFGYLGSNVGNNYNTCYTMWRYTLKNPSAESIEVRATDRFGNTYTESKIEDNTDIDYAFYDPQYNPPME